jgi:hypothetical protein
VALSQDWINEKKVQQFLLLDECGCLKGGGKTWEEILKHWSYSIFPKVEVSDFSARPLEMRDCLCIGAPSLSDVDQAKSWAEKAKQVFASRQELKKATFVIAQAIPAACKPILDILGEAAVIYRLPAYSSGEFMRSLSPDGGGVFGLLDKLSVRKHGDSYLIAEWDSVENECMPLREFLQNKTAVKPEEVQEVLKQIELRVRDDAKTGCCNWGEFTQSLGNVLSELAKTDKPWSSVFKAHNFPQKVLPWLTP